MFKRTLCAGRKGALVTLALLATASTLPLAAEPLPKIGAIFAIESPEVFPDQILGRSKAAIEQELSALLAERLKFFFPFFDWTAGEAPSANGVLVKMVDVTNELCDWQTLFSVRAVRAGNEAEMVGVHDQPLYDLCDPFIPNRRDPNGDALLPEDAAALVDKLKKYIENGAGESGGLLSNTTILKAIHDNLLATVPLTMNFELREQTDGTKRLYLPLDFNELQVAQHCKNEFDNCSLLGLTLNLPNSPPASLALRIEGLCGDLVLCEVLSGGVPGGFQITDPTYWNDGLADLLARAQSSSFTMKEFTKSLFVCALGEP